MITTVTGIYANRNAAHVAVDELVAAGFTRDHISLVLKATPDVQEILHEETDTTVRGAITGAVVGGAFAALLVGGLALPAIGLVLAGPIVTSLAAGGAGAAAGTLMGALIARGVSEQAAADLLTHVQQGDVIVGVDAQHAEVASASDVLRDTGAIDVTSRLHSGHPLRNHDHYLEN